MSSEERLSRLLARWQELAAWGPPPSVSELCSDCPELQSELQRRVYALSAETISPADPADAVPSTILPVKQGPSPPQPAEVATPPTILPLPGDRAATQTYVPSPQTAEAERRPAAPPGYEILGVLGRGGMGVVYKAHQVGLDRTCALKMILAGSYAGEAEVARFRTEAEAIAHVRHPGIVQVYEVGEHEGKAFFSLEFCDGGSLDRKLKGVPLPFPEAARLVQALAEATQAAHSNAVIHRDLKPANVLLAAAQAKSPGEGVRLRGEPYLPKITDFGLAKKLDEAGQTHTGDVMGTPSYMAPEQARGDRVGPLADTYALGAILYECLTGRPPFKGATALDTVALVVNQEPARPSQVNPSVPRDLETVCLKCLQKEPEKRYASAQELANDLGRYLNGEPIEARPVGAVERGSKWVRRNKAVSLLAAAAMLAVVAGMTFSGMFAYSASKEAKAATLATEKAMEKAKAEEEAKEREKAAKIQAVAQRDRAEWLLYASRLQAAWREWQAGRPDLAWQHLDSCGPEFRHFEHRYLATLFGQHHATWRGHADEVNGVAFSPDGGRIASVSGDFQQNRGEVKVFDARTGQTLLSLPHKVQVSCVAFSPDGSRIATGGSDRHLRVWDARTGVPVYARIAAGLGVNCLAYSPDGSRIVTGSADNSVYTFDARTGKFLFGQKAHPFGVRAVAFSPDSSRFVSGGGDNEAHLWDARTGQLLRTFRGHGKGKPIGLGLGPARGTVDAIAFSPDGARVATAAADETIRVWDVRSGDVLLTIASGQLACLAYSSDGSRLASGDWERMVKVWDARTGRHLFTHKGHTGNVLSVAFGPDGARLVTGGDDRTVRLWDATSAQGVLTLPAPPGAVAIGRVGFTADNSAVVSTYFGHADLRVWDVRTGRERLAVAAASSQAAVSPVSPDGSRLVSATGDETLGVFDARTGRKLLALEGRPGPVNALAYGAGDRIASAGRDKMLRVWEATTGRRLLAIEAFAADGRCVTFSPDGSRLAAAGDDLTVRVWDTATGKPLLSLGGHNGMIVQGVAFSPDGERIVTAGNDRTLRVWEARNGQHLLTLAGHADRVTEVAFSPDGSRLVSGAGDGTLRVWEAHRRAAWPGGAAAPRGREVGGRAYASDGLASGEDGGTPDRDYLDRLARFDTDWHLAEARQAEDDGHWFAAAFRVSLLSRHNPLDASLHVRLAHLHAGAGERDKAALHLTQALLLNPRVPLWPLDPDAARRGEAAARAGDWSRAARLFRLAAHQPGAPHESWLALLLAQRAAGEDASEAAARWIGATDDGQPMRVAEWIEALPLREQDVGPVLAVTGKLLKAKIQNPSADLHNHGVATFQAGRYDEAWRLFAGAVAAAGNGGDPGSWPYLAQIAWRRGKHAEAKGWLARYEGWMKGRAFPDWKQGAVHRILLDECRRAVDRPPPMPPARDGE